MYPPVEVILLVFSTQADGVVTVARIILGVDQCHKHTAVPMQPIEFKDCCYYRNGASADGVSVA